MSITETVSTVTPTPTDAAAETASSASSVTSIDLATSTVRDFNQALHSVTEPAEWHVTNPSGLHNIAVGINTEQTVTVDGHVGYYFAGMNQLANITVNGNAGVGLAENMMSGTVHVTGDSSQATGATAHGGLIVVDGNTGARCGISMKGVNIVVGGDIGHMSAFMAQAGTLVVCGDAGESLGDSIYEARIYVKGTVESLGADCIQKDMRQEHLDELAGLLTAAGRDDDPAAFTRYGSARTLYHFNVDNSSAY